MLPWTTRLLILLGLTGFVAADNVTEDFRENGIIPDVISAENLLFLKVNYEDGTVNLGNVLTPTQVQNVPNVTLEFGYYYYVLALVDPDAPSRTNRSFSEVMHWLVGNIPAGYLDMGDTIAAYVGSAPPLGTGLHRYVFLLFKQPGRLMFDEPRLQVNGTGLMRTGFSISEFANKYDLGQPIAGNFFVAQYDDSTNATLALLGL